MKSMPKLLSLLILSMIWIVLPAGLASPGSAIVEEQQSKFKRLILKDGSYELIGQYSIQEDRVHYFSIERREWEDMPYSLVDWKATEEFAAEDSRNRSERKDEALARTAGERSEDEAHSPLVASGLRLPAPDGVFLLDFYRERPELVPLNQNDADLKKNLGHNILRGVINPIAGSKQTIELNGLHSRVQSHTANPSIYISIDSSDPTQGYTSKSAQDHLRIVHCEQKKENRVVSAINIAVYGKVKQSAQFVEAKVEPISDRWAKIAPIASLEPGEYALVEYDENGAMNQLVWDFGMDPQAPPNLNVIRSSSDRNEPVLIQKPRKKP
jgi:hypothetical protein